MRPWLLVLYHHHGGNSDAPWWWIARRLDLDKMTFIDSLPETTGPGRDLAALVAQEIQRRIVEPSRAVRGVGDERYVLVADREGVLHRADVAVASDDGRTAVVASGISMDDRVVVAGSVLARDGARAEVTEQEPE